MPQSVNASILSSFPWVAAMAAMGVTGAAAVEEGEGAAEEGAVVAVNRAVV